MSQCFKDITTVSSPQPQTAHHWSFSFQALVIMNTCFSGSRFVVINCSPQSIKFWLHLLNNLSSTQPGPASILLVFIQHGEFVLEIFYLPLSILCPLPPQPRAWSTTSLAPINELSLCPVLLTAAFFRSDFPHSRQHYPFRFRVGP